MKVEFYLAEVLSSDITNTYKEDGHIAKGTKSKNLFAIRVRTYSGDSVKEYIAIPVNNSIKEIPLIGEHVLIFKGLRDDTTPDKARQEWYYFPAYGLKSGINSNLLPGIAQFRSGTINVPFQTTPGNTFEEKIISPLQPYEGDILVEGRWGNSIRLGSSISNDVAGEDFYTVNPTWKSTNENRGDPIIILSNKRNNKPGHNEFVIENNEKDGASLYLTSTQNFPNFTLSKPLGNHGSKSESEYNSPQLIGSADRIILQAKKDIIALDAKTRVTINTPELKIGDESACEAMVHGDVLMSILVDILNVISAGSIGTAGITTLPLDKGALANAFKQLQYLNSSKYFIKRDS